MAGKTHIHCPFGTKVATVLHLNHARTCLIMQGHLPAGGPFLASLEFIKRRRELTRHTHKDGPHNLNLKWINLKTYPEIYLANCIHIQFENSSDTDTYFWKISEIFVSMV